MKENRIKNIIIGVLLVLIFIAALAAVIIIRRNGQKMKAEEPYPTMFITETKVTPIPAPKETPVPDPETQSAKARFDIALEAGTLNRGDQVTVIKEDGDNYVVLDGSNRTVYVAKAYVKTDRDEKTEEHDAWAAGNASLYPTAFMDGDPLTVLSYNSKVRVLDALNGICYVKYSEGEGYPVTEGFMKAEDLSDTERQIWSGNGDSGWSGGAPSGGGGYDAPPAPPAPPAPAGGGYGDDIVLCSFAPMNAANIIGAVINNMNTPDEVKGTVFTDGLKEYAGFVEKGGDVNLIAKDGDEHWTALENHMVCEIPAFSVLLEGEEEPFEEFDGFIVMDGGTLYSDMQLTADAERIAPNSKLHVVGMYGDVYEVDITEQSIDLDYRHGFIKTSEVTDQQHIWVDAGGGGGYSGGGSSGGGGAPASSGDWSEFVM